MNKWYLIYCKPQQDLRAEQNLKRQNFDVFRPIINVVKSRIGSKGIVKSESLFPRYLFISVDPHIQSIAPVFSTYGVSSFVRFGNDYATASEDLINEIKANVERQIVIANDREQIKNGDEIYVEGHGFDGVKAIYCNSCGDQRALILMDILGRESKLQVPFECLTKRRSVG